MRQNDQGQTTHNKKIIVGAAIGTGATIGGLYALLKPKGGLIDKIAASKAREIVAKKAEDAGLQRAAKKAAKAGFQIEAATEEAARNPHPFSGLTASDVVPKRIVAENELVEHYHHAEAREHFHKVTAKHVAAIEKDPSRENWKYYSEPYDAQHPPKAGRYVPPEKHDRLVQDYTRRQEAKRVRAKLAARQEQPILPSTAPLRRQKNQPSAFRAAPVDLERRVKTTHFDISLKESRGPGGRFASGGAPMLSPRDMQNAYHAPFKQSEEKKGSIGGKVAKIAGIGIGAAATVGGLALLNPTIRRRVFNQAVEATQSVEKAAAAPVVGTPFSRGTREAYEAKVAEANAARKAAFDEKYRRQAAEHASDQTILKSQHKVETAGLKQENKTLYQITNEQERALDAEKTAHLKTKDQLEAHKEVLKAGITSPILGPQGQLANPVAKAGVAKAIFNRQGQRISNPLTTNEQLRQRLVGNPENPREKGHLKILADRITENQGKLAKAEREGATNYQKDKLANAIHTDTVAHGKYTTVLKDLDEGAITHPQIAAHLYDIEIQGQRKAAEEDINKEINSIAKSRAAARKVMDQQSRQAAREAAEKDREMRKLTESQPGWTGHDYHGKAPTSKNRGKGFSDARLATRLSRAIKGEIHEPLCPGMIELEKKDHSKLIAGATGTAGFFTTGIIPPGRKVKEGEDLTGRRVIRSHNRYPILQHEGMGIGGGMVAEVHHTPDMGSVGKIISTPQEKFGHGKTVRVLDKVVDAPSAERATKHIGEEIPYSLWLRNCQRATETMKKNKIPVLPRQLRRAIYGGAVAAAAGYGVSKIASRKKEIQPGMIQTVS